MNTIEFIKYNILNDLMFNFYNYFRKTNSVGMQTIDMYRVNHGVIKTSGASTVMKNLKTSASLLRRNTDSKC